MICIFYCLLKGPLYVGFQQALGCQGLSSAQQLEAYATSLPHTRGVWLVWPLRIHLGQAWRASPFCGPQLELLLRTLGRRALLPLPVCAVRPCKVCQTPVLLRSVQEVFHSMREEVIALVQPSAFAAVRGTSASRALLVFKFEKTVRKGEI